MKASELESMSAEAEGREMGFIAKTLYQSEMKMSWNEYELYICKLCGFLNQSKTKIDITN